MSTANLSLDQKDQMAHDTVPDSLLSEKIVADAALKKMIEKGQEVAPEAVAIVQVQQGKASDGPKEGGKGGERSHTESEGRKRGKTRDPRSQQRVKPLAEQLSEVSASQLQLSELTSQIQALTKVCGRTSEDMSSLSKRVDLLSTESKVSTANQRQAHSALASRLVTLENRIAAVTSRVGSEAPSTRATMTAAQLADTVSSQGITVPGTTRVRLSGEGVPGAMSTAAGAGSAMVPQTELAVGETSRPELEGGVLITAGQRSTRGRSRPSMTVRSPPSTTRGLARGVPISRGATALGVRGLGRPGRGRGNTSGVPFLTIATFAPELADAMVAGLTEEPQEPSEQGDSMSSSEGLYMPALD